MWAVSRTQADLDAIVKEHPGVTGIRLDVSNWNETKNILTASLPEKLDVLINNAAVLDTFTQLEITEEAIDRYHHVMIMSFKVSWQSFAYRYGFTGFSTRTSRR